MAQGTPVPINTHSRYSSVTASESLDLSSNKKFAIKVEEITAAQRENRKILTPNELYPNLEENDGPVIQALRLISNCCEYLLSALRIDPKLDFIAYDEKMMRARDSLRKLYALRAIGDGFGATINAIIWSLWHKETEALTARQISTIVEVLNQLRKRPMLHFDSSMSLMDQLEDSELDIEPPFTKLLIESENVVEYENE